MFKRFLKRISDWVDKQNAIADAEDKKWDHMFNRLWESRQERMDK